jgi:cell division protein FtsQ
MDGRGRLVEPLKRERQARRKRPAQAAEARRRTRAGRQRRDRLRQFAEFTASYTTAPIGRVLQRALRPVVGLRLPRGFGAVASALFVVASVSYGVVKGGHVSEILARATDLRDATANTLGFRIAAIALVGQKQVSREEILATAGVTGRTSLLFLDAAIARDRLKTNPWIADATVLKLYPDRLQVQITERQAFALWQKDGRVAVIAGDGTVLEPYVARRFTGLPLVVGAGAETRAKEFLAVVDRYPEIRDALRASVLIAERRWNLRLKNGLDIRLPETEIESAFETLVKLDHEKKLLSRDITAIDLRLPDRVTVRLSDSAAQARDEALKPKTVKRKGGAA